MKTKTQFTNRILSLVLSIMMVVSMLPMNILTANAAETTESAIDLSTLTGTYVISDSGEYTFTGSGSYGIKVESGNPTLVLNNASITVGEGSAIDVASGSNATIFVQNDNSLSTTAQYSDTTAGGIFVAEGGTVNITSNSTNNTIRVTGNTAAAIGGKYAYGGESYNAGSISISNVTVYAYTNNFYASAIGAAGEGTCGTINITNAVVYAYGAGDDWSSAPGIGSAWSLMGWPETIPIVIISDSEIHTFRYNSYSDYIGHLGDENGHTYATGGINCGEDGSVINSTIYCYTGLDATTTDKVVKYGAQGGLLKEDGTCEGEHSGGTQTCMGYKCANCANWYGEKNENHDWSGKDGICTNGCGTTHDHAEDDWNNGICTNCDTYQPATLVTNENYESFYLKADYVGYYAISNAGQLFWFAQQVNEEENKEIKGVLTADIDLEKRPWTPIGAMGEGNSFRGIFDGLNYTIRGLYVEGSENGVGFFGEVRTGTVKNFTIYGNVVVNTEVDYVGGVIGSICGVNGATSFEERNGAIVQNITSIVNITVKAHGVGTIGGLVGHADHESLIEQCVWYGTFNAGEYRVDSGAGGFIGKIQENTGEVTIRNCGAYGTIKTGYEKNSYNNYATIYMGGFLSFSNTGAKTVLENCLFAGKFERGANLTDEAKLAAFGTLRSVNAIKNCYYLGDDGLAAVHSDSDLKPGSDNVEITSVTEEELRGGTIAIQLGDFWEQGEHYPKPKDTGGHSHSYTYTDNGDGTHKATCTACGAMVDNETHTPAENTTYTDNGDGTHSFTCTVCGTATEAHTYVGRQCDCGAEDTSAYITGVALTVDGVTYTGAEGEGTVYITPTSQITVTIYGANLQNAPKNDHPAVSGFLVWFAAGDGTINAAGTESTIVSSPSEWTDERNIELFLVNVNSSTGDLEFDDDTGIIVTYVTGAGTDLTEIYFNNANAWETITATFYTAEDIYGDSHQLDTAELSLVGGESVIYSTTNIPKNAAYVTFSNGTETTGIIEIPMAADGTNCYKAGVWEHYHHGEVSYALTDDGKQHIATYDCCGATVTENHTATYFASDNIITASCSKCKVTLGTATITAENTIYDGAAQETANVAYSDGWTGGELTISYENNVNAGTATASITIGEATASVDFSIAKATVTVMADAKSKPYGYEDPTLTYTSEGLLGDDVLTGALTREEGENAGSYAITLGTLTAGDNYTISFTGAELTITDGTAPTGRILIKENVWNKFWNTITFGIFCKDYVDVTITADGTGSGIAKVEYLLSDTVLEENNIPVDGWTTLNADNDKYSFSIKPQNKVVVYVRITDEGGNVTVINSDGIVVYEDSKAVDTEVAYTYKENSNKDIAVEFNGNTVNSIVCGEKDLAANTDYSVDYESGKIVLKATYLDTLNAGDYTFTVSYNPMGVENSGVTDLTTTFTLIIDKADGKVSSINISNKTYDGTAVTAPTFDKLGDGAATIEYKLSDADDNTYTTTAPKNAGNYVVRVTVAESTNYKAASAKTYFAIASAELRDVSVQQVGTLTYTGEALTPAVSTNAVAVNNQPITFTYSTESEGPYSTEIPSFTNAGWAHTVYYIATADNHNTYYGSFLVEIEKATVTEPTIASKPYTGSAQTADITDTELYTVVKNDGGTGVKLNGYYDVVLKLTDSANYKWSTTDNAQVTLQFKITCAENEWTVNPSITGWTYGENANTPVGVAKFGDVSIQYIGTANDGTQINSTTAPTKVGSYTATFIVQETEDYKGLETSVDFTIAKADQAAPTGLTKTDTTYFGKADGKISGLTSAMEFRKEGDSTYTASFNGTLEYLAAGTYYVRYQGDANHNPSPDAVVTVNAGRKLQIVVPQNQVGYTVTVNKTEMEYEGSYTLKVEIHEGYTATEDFKIIISNWECGQQAGVEKNYMNAIADQIIEVRGVADITPPAAEIKVKENKWTSFWNNLTFGLFFKETQDVTITATDKGSGVKSIQYYLFDRELERDEVRSITDWIDYNGTFKINPDNRYVIYVKVTDNAGNVEYINSEGMVLDATAPVLYGIENGGVYHGDKVFKALDDYLKILKVDGVDVMAELNGDNEYKIIADNTEHTVIAIDEAGNVTEYKITVYKNYTVTYKADGEPISTETVGHGKDANLPAVPAKNGYVGKWDSDGKNITGDTTITVVYTEIPVVKPNEVKPEDKTDLEDTKKQLEDMLKDDSYTDDDKKDIQDVIDDIDDALEVIGNVEAVEESIVMLPAVDTVKPDDEEAIKAITDAQTAYNALSDYEKSLVDEATKAALDKLATALVAYDIVEGDGSSWTEDSNHNITFVVNGLFSKFVGIKVDGKDVDKANYEVKAGSTIITLKASYLDTLAVGEHTITVVYTDGSTDGTFNVHAKANSPATGDNSNMFLWVALLFISGGAVITLTVVERKKRTLIKK